MERWEARQLIQVLLPHLQPDQFALCASVCASWRRYLDWRFFRAACWRVFQRTLRFWRNQASREPDSWRETWCRAYWLALQSPVPAFAVLDSADYDSDIEVVVFRSKKRAARWVRLDKRNANTPMTLAIVPCFLSGRDSLIVTKGCKVWHPCYLSYNLNNVRDNVVNHNCSRHYLNRGGDQSVIVSLSNANISSEGKIVNAKIRY